MLMELVNVLLIPFVFFSIRLDANSPAYAVPKRGCGILVKDVQSLVEPRILPAPQ